MLENDHRASAIQVIGDDHRSLVAEDVLLPGPVSLSGRGCSVEIRSGSRLEHEGSANLVEIAGEGSSLVMDQATTFRGFIKISGDRSHVNIAAGCTLTGKINIKADDCVVLIGQRTTANGLSVQMHEPGRISIGDDCMISKEVYISNSDIHPIYDASTGVRINPARSIEIGDHVWLGLRTMVLKGATIGGGSVVGAGSIVAGSIPANCVANGSPARVVREDIRWERDFVPIGSGAISSES